jgi:N-acyl-D-amino-acid deacylase
MILDTLITNAAVLDGSGGPARAVAVGILGDRIALVGEPPVGLAARHTLDATGRLLCPGFIDTHASTGLGYMLPHAADHKLRQGVTTEVIGNCGTSEAPVGARLLVEARRRAAAVGATLTWRGLGEWLSQLDRHGLPINVATHIGHGTLRAGAGAWEPALSAEQHDTMTALLAEGLGAGALGLSTGLIYAPGSFADTGEIIALARQVAAAGGVYVSHIRDERAGLLDAIEEALTIADRAGLPAIISHLKAAERANWGKIPAVLERLERARAAGQAVTVEVYPYTAVSTRLHAFLPTAAMREGSAGLPGWLRDPDNRARAAAHLRARGTDFQALTLITESLPGARGRSIAALARGGDPAEQVLAVLSVDPEAFIVYRCIDEADMNAALLWPDAIVCSDSWSLPVNATTPVGDPHPRTYGAFTRFIEEYALARPRLSLGAAIRRVTRLPADWLGLTDRGRIAVGAAADLVLLSPDRVHARATYEDPRQFSEGTEQVWVNGRPMFDGEQRILPRLPGRTLRRHGAGQAAWKTASRG